MPRIRTARAAAAALVMVAAAALSAEARAFEYGPEAEARFLVLCLDETGRSAAECRQASERLQARLGYEAFLANAYRGPAGFDPAVVAFGTPSAPVVATAAAARE